MVETIRHILVKAAIGLDRLNLTLPGQLPEDSSDIVVPD